MNAFGTTTLAALMAAMPATTPTNVGTAFDPASLEGVWDVTNSAEIIAVGKNEVVYYDSTSASCIETDRRPVAHLLERFGGRLVARDTATATLSDRTGYLYQLSRLDALPALCARGGTTGADPVLNFESFISYFRENYAGDALRHLDWQAIHDEFRPRVTARTTTDELWKVYAEILARFDDVHVFVSNGKQGTEGRSLSAGRPSGLRKALIVQDPKRSEDDGFALDAKLAPLLDNVILFEVLRGRFSTDLQGKFQWGWATPEIGYLNIQQMSGLFAKPATDPAVVAPAVRETMRKVIKEFGTAKALILDVRQNRGGADAVSSAVAAVFADRPVTSKSRTRTRSGFTDWESDTVQPDPSNHFDKPVYLLISDNTVSAAESFVSIMRQYPTVTLVGTTTRGALSAILVKKLPDGSILGLSDMQFISPAGVNYETKGIPPDIHVESYQPECLFTCYKQAIDVAVKLALARSASAGGHGQSNFNMARKLQRH